MVDAEDYPALTRYKWFFTNGYAARNITVSKNRRHRIYMHDVILGVTDGVDHIDRDGLNNRASNLRPASHSLQGFNRLIQKREYPRGVYKVGSSYFSAIKLHGRSIRLGTFSTPERAYEVYRAKYFEINGEYPPEWTNDGR